MASKRQKLDTKTISFRLEAVTADAIVVDAKELVLSTATYFLSQITPGSRLATILEEAQERIIKEDLKIQEFKNELFENANLIKQRFGLSEDDFKVVASQALSTIIQTRLTKS